MAERKDDQVQCVIKQVQVRKARADESTCILYACMHSVPTVPLRPYTGRGCVASLPFLTERLHLLCASRQVTCDLDARHLREGEG